MGKKIFLLAGFLLTPSAIFFSGQNSAQKIPRHDAAAVVKLIPVRVLDQNGRPLTNLKKEDFILFDNKERKILKAPIM